MVGATSYLPNARLPLRRLQVADLECMIGETPESGDNLDPDVGERLETIETALDQILERLHSMQVIGEIKSAKEELKQIEANKKKG